MRISKKVIFSIVSLLILAGTVLLVTPSCSKALPADLVLVNGIVVTMDKTIPTAEAVAVRQGRILAVGTTKEIKTHATGATQIIDLEGKLAIPGLIESHGHFIGLGRSRMQLDLTQVNNWDDVIDMVNTAVSKAKPGEWILGRGWHQEKWNKIPEPNVDGLPLHQSLSAVSPENPVMLTHASGHSCFANARAMELGGVDETTTAPEGGEIVKDGSGKPIGVFRETAQDLVRRALSRYRATLTAEQLDREQLEMIRQADRACLENGITTFHDAGVSFSDIDRYKQVVQEGKLGVRIDAMISESNRELREKISRYKIIGLGDNHLTVRMIKRLIDGALGSHGAWLLEPYLSLPSSTGLNIDSISDMKEVARIAIENGFQLCTHAIGDRGNRETLDIYQEAFEQHPDKKDLRWRIEHAQHLHPGDIPRFGRLKVIAAMQGIHCTSDAPWVFKRLGEKRAEEGAYVWQKLMNTGAVICNGTDVPVENVNPIACYYATVTRKTKDGSVFFGEQKMTREQALASYTINGAYSAFEEDIKGSLTVGKLADITVLSENILTVPDDRIPQTRVLYTIVGGRVMYKKQ